MFAANTSVEADFHRAVEYDIAVVGGVEMVTHPTNEWRSQDLRCLDYDFPAAFVVVGIVVAVAGMNSHSMMLLSNEGRWDYP